MTYKEIVVLACSVFLSAAGLVDAQTVQLPKTGQTSCFDWQGQYEVIPCSGTGQDGEYRMGIPWPDPRFTVDGDCVTDNLTGLIWARDGNLLNLPDYFPDLSPPYRTRTWNDAIDYANGLGLCGYDDWRLPNVNELQSLVNANESYTSRWLNTQGFTNIQDFLYWSSTTYAGDTRYARLVRMADGYEFTNLKGDDSEYGYGYIIPVRGNTTPPAELWKTGQTESYRTADDGYYEAGAAWPNPRFSENGECVIDNLTGLIWTRNANLPGGQRTWKEALEFSKSLTLCGYSDWRLPNRAELMSLIDRSQYGPALPLGNPFLSVQSDYYFASTTQGYPGGRTWGVDMLHGHVLFNSMAVSGDAGYVWPVNGPKLADLVEVSVRSPRVTWPGATFRVTDSVKNQGKGSANSSVTAYYISGSGAKDDNAVRIGSRSVPVLRSGAGSTGSALVNVPLSVPLGTYYLIACADDTGVVPETDKTNNCMPSPTSVNVTLPDLLETSLGSHSSTVVIGGRVTSVTDTVMNQGGVPSVPSTTGYYLSTGATQDNNSILVGSRRVPAIKAGGKSTGTAKIIVPWSISVGTYYLIACADYTAVVAETDKTNNCMTLATTIMVSAPDLTETVAGGPLPETAAIGATLTMTDTVQNLGGAASVASTTRYYLSISGDMDGSAILLDGKRLVPALKAGAMSTGKAKVKIPSTTTAGTYYVLACADDLKQVPESNESNNCAAFSTTVAITP